MEALQIAHAKQMPVNSTTALFYLGALLAKESDTASVTEPVKLQRKAKALELMTLIGRHPVTEPFFKNKAAHLQAQLEADLPREVVTVAQKRGKTRQLVEVVAEMVGEA